MSDENIKKDPVIQSMLDEGGLEHPSNNFTNQIINSIKAQTKESAFVYKPVISKNVWLGLIFAGVSLFIYLVFSLSPESQFLNLNGFSMDFDASRIREIIPQISFSLELSSIMKTALIALSFFTFSNLIIFELKSRSFFK